VLVRYSPFLDSLKNWKTTYRITTDFVTSSLYFSFTNQYLLAAYIKNICYLVLFMSKIY
jgi:hypothetical protein